MDVSQMLADCSVSLETAMGRNFPKRIFIGRIIGTILKPQFLNSKPMIKSAPTDKSYLIAGNHEFEEEKLKLIKLIDSSNRFAVCQ